jgi:hypothetical protein
MKLSHSAIPTFSPPGAELSFLFVVVVGVPAGTGEVAVDGVSALRFVGAPHASTSRPASMQTIKRKNLDTLIPLFAGWKSAQDNTPCYQFYD